MTGIKASIGPPVPAPAGSASQPTGTRVTTPNEPAAASRFITAAVTWMRILRERDHQTQAP